MGAGPNNLSHSLLLSQDTRGELNWKWGSQGIDPCSYRMPVLETEEQPDQHSELEFRNKTFLKIFGSGSSTYKQGKVFWLNLVTYLSDYLIGR